METERIGQMVELLGRSLQVEYRIIVHYPKLMAMLPDEETRNLALTLGLDSIRHADTVREVIMGLGEEPPFPSVDALPDVSVRDIFRRQLEYEKLAFLLHTEAANLASPEHKAAFRRIAQEESHHIEGVERILKKL